VTYPLDPADRPLALVTGASRGIGRAVATGLAAAGCDVVATARDADALDHLATEIREGGGHATIASADLADPAAPTRLLEACPRLPDLLVNNAGTAPSAALAATTDEDLATALALHVAAPFRLLRAALPAMAERGTGCAIQMGSTAGLRGFAFTSAYTAAKHGMVGLTRALREEFGRKGLHLYAVCPGFVDTDITRRAAADVARKGRNTPAEILERMGAMNRIGRLHTPADVAAAVIDLWRERPTGCVLELDHEPPRFVDP